MSLGKMQDSKNFLDRTNEQNIKNLVVVIKTRTIITFFWKNSCDGRSSFCKEKWKIALAELFVVPAATAVHEKCVDVS